MIDGRYDYVKKVTYSKLKSSLYIVRLLYNVNYKDSYYKQI